MNKKQIALIVIPFALVLGFQNCQKPAGITGNDLVNNTKPDPSLAVPVEVIPLKNESLKVIEFNDVREESNIQNAKAGSGLKSLTVFQVNIETGHMQFVSLDPQVAHIGMVYCLDKAGKQELFNILNSDSICKLENPSPVGTTCHMAVDEGYATLFTEREQFGLGSANNGCRSKEVKLCNSDEQLQQWLVRTKARLSSLRNCQ